MKVRATKLGYYGILRRRPGDVFWLVDFVKKGGEVVPPEKQFSANWMELVEDQSVRKPKTPRPEKPESVKPTGDQEVI